jgi:hypothetical protein
LLKTQSARTDAGMERSEVIETKRAEERLIATNTANSCTRSQTPARGNAEKAEREQVGHKRSVRALRAKLVVKQKP